MTMKLKVSFHSMLFSDPFQTLCHRHKYHADPAIFDLDVYSREIKYVLPITTKTFIFAYCPVQMLYKQSLSSFVELQLHHHHRHHHLTLHRECRWGTTDYFTTSFPIFPCSPLPSGTWRTPGLSWTGQDCNQISVQTLYFHYVPGKYVGHKSLFSDFRFYSREMTPVCSQKTCEIFLNRDV